MNESQSISPEIQNHADLLGSLREGREFQAQIHTERYMRGILAAPDRITNSHVALTEAGVGGLGYDESQLSPANLMAFEAIGLSSDYLLEHTGSGSLRETETIPDVQIDKFAVKIEQYGGGVSIRIENSETESALRDATSPPAIIDLVKDRFAASPAHRELNKLAEHATDLELPSELTTEWFNPAEDPLGSLTFLIDTGIAPVRSNIATEMRSGKHPLEIINSCLSNPASGVTVESSEDVTTYTWGLSVNRQLSINQLTGAWRYGVIAQPEKQYPEFANQQSGAESVPFIDTECAQDIINWAESQELTIAPHMQHEMMRVGQAERFGSIYTQLSREIAKWVDSPNRIDVTSLFVPKESAPSGKD